MKLFVARFDPEVSGDGARVHGEILNGSTTSSC